MSTHTPPGMRVASSALKLDDKQRSRMWRTTGSSRSMTRPTEEEDAAVENLVALVGRDDVLVALGAAPPEVVS